MNIHAHDCTPDQEAEANYFARCLLMPEAMVREEVGKVEKFDLLNTKHVADLAKCFEVDVPIMAFRLAEIFIPRHQ